MYSFTSTNFPPFPFFFFNYFFCFFFFLFFGHVEEEDDVKCRQEPMYMITVHVEGQVDTDVE